MIDVANCRTLFADKVDGWVAGICHRRRGGQPPRPDRWRRAGVEDRIWLVRFMDHDLGLFRRRDIRLRSARCGKDLSLRPVLTGVRETEHARLRMVLVLVGRSAARVVGGGEGSKSCGKLKSKRARCALVRAGRAVMRRCALSSNVRRTAAGQRRQKRCLGGGGGHVDAGTCRARGTTAKAKGSPRPWHDRVGDRRHRYPADWAMSVPTAMR